MKKEITEWKQLYSRLSGSPGIFRAAVVFLLLSVSSCSSFFPEIDSNKMVEAKRLCSKVPLPKGSMKIREREINRGPTGIFTSTYSTSSEVSSYEEVFLRSFLSSDGWALSREKGSIERKWHFKKGAWEIDILVSSSFTKSKSVFVSCSW